MVEENSGFWSRVWQYIKAVTSSLWKWLLRYPILIPITVLLIVLAVMAVAAGKNFQIGGILGKLWGSGSKDSKRAVPPEDRVDKDGKSIQPGESDDKGFVQAPVKTNIKDPGIFSDPNVIIIVEDGKETEIPLPRGISNKDIKEVIRIAPRIYEVHNNDKGISIYELDNLINELDSKL